MSPSDSSEVGKQSAFQAIMERVKNASEVFALDDIRFVDIGAAIGPAKDVRENKIGIQVQAKEPVLHNGVLTVVIQFMFTAPSPEGEDADAQNKSVSVRGKVQVRYVAADEARVDPQDAVIFGRVNGIHNAWPYLREYLHASLVRLGLPPFELPLLHVGTAVQLAGVLDGTAMTGANDGGSEE